MAKFPRTEAEIIALALQMIAGLNSPSSSFTSPPFTGAELQTELDKFLTERNEATAAEAVYRIEIDQKDDQLDVLSEMMKSDLRYAENDAKGNEARLEELSWSGKAEGTALQIPEQPRTLEAPQQGDGYVFLDWKEPIGGGAVAAYKIQRRERPAGAWEEVGSAIPSEFTLINQPKNLELEYRIIAFNRAGESVPSNTAMVVL